MRVYVAGGMSGLPLNNFPAFFEAAEYLESWGFDVENPATNPKQRSWSDYMRIAITQLLTCDSIALLEGWQLSKGARLEALIARQLGIPAIYL